MIFFYQLRSSIFEYIPSEHAAAQTTTEGAAGDEMTATARTPRSPGRYSRVKLLAAEISRAVIAAAFQTFLILLLFAVTSQKLPSLGNAI